MSAFEELVRRYEELAFRTGYLVLRDPGAAEDVAQEAFDKGTMPWGDSSREAPFVPGWCASSLTRPGTPGKRPSAAAPSPSAMPRIREIELPPAPLNLQPWVMKTAVCCWKPWPD